MANKTDTMTAAVGCIIIGAMAGPIFGYPLIGFGMNVLGMSVFALEYVSKMGKGKYEKLWNPLKLYVENKDIKLYPLVLDETETKEGKTLRIQLPIGLSSDEFNKKSTHLKEHFKAEDISFSFKDGFLFMNLRYNKLEPSYEFEPIETKSILGVPIGRSLKGIYVLDILDGPHVLIGGGTGSGKSTLIRTIITYLILKKNVNLHLSDLKEFTEFKIFRKCEKVKTCAKTIEETTKVIKDLMKESKRRYNLFNQYDDVTNIAEYNKKFKKNQLTYEVLIIDECADLAESDEAIESLIELARKARAAGIDIVLATQKPDSRTIDTRIKTNFDYVVGLKTGNHYDSQIILGSNGLENLKGKGHALVRTTDITEIQCFNLSVSKARDLIKHTYVKESNNNFSKKVNESIRSFDFLDDM